MPGRAARAAPDGRPRRTADARGGLGARRRRLDHDHAALLRGDQRLRRCQRDDLLDAQRLAEREHLQRRPLLLRQVGHALGDELYERSTHGRRARQPPQARAEDEPSGVERAEHELADVERVSLAALADPPQRPLLHRPAERRLHELLDGRVVQRFELHAQRARVLPERHDGVGARLAGTNGGDDERAARDRQVQHERGGHRVEQLRVVDADDDLAPTGALGERLHAAAHEGEGVARPDAGARAHHEAAAGAVGARAHDPPQLLDAAYERPGRTGSEHPRWLRGLQHALSYRVYVRRSRQSATLTGNVAAQIAAPRNTTQPIATSAVWARGDRRRVLRPAKKSVIANSTTHSV